MQPFSQLSPRLISWVGTSCNGLFFFSSLPASSKALYNACIRVLDLSTPSTLSSKLHDSLPPELLRRRHSPMSMAPYQLFLSLLFFLLQVSAQISDSAIIVGAKNISVAGQTYNWDPEYRCRLLAHASR